MSQILDTLAQVTPNATTWTKLYFCSATGNGKSVSGTIRVCNSSGNAGTFSISTKKDGGDSTFVPDASHYDAYAVSITGIPVDLSIVAGPNDVIQVYASIAGIGFKLMGSEVSN